MIADNALQAAAARDDPLDAAAETREKMRLDEAGDDPDIRLGQVPVDQGRAAVPHRAELHQPCGIFRFVIDYAIIAHHVRGQQLFQFGLGVGPVGADLVQQENLSARQIGQIFQQPGNKPLVGCGPGQIREGDADPVARLDPFPQGP